MNKGMGLLIAVLGIWGVAGWGLLLRPYVVKGSGATLPALPGGTASVGNGGGVYVASEPGYVTSWRVGADGKLTRVDTQVTVPMDRRMQDATSQTLKMNPEAQLSVPATGEPTATPTPAPTPTAPEPPPAAATP
jgi:hypothetical protein